MGTLHDLAQYLGHIHGSGDWGALLQFYAIVTGVIIFVCLQLLLTRSRPLAIRAMQHVRELTEDMRRLHGEMDDLERRMEKRLDNRAGELDGRMTKKMDQKGDLLQERIEQRASSLSNTIYKLESRVSQSSEDVERFRTRIDEVENRIPSLFDRLDDFRDTLGKTFQVELSAVLNSFDNSLASVLQQMKADLQLGLSRVEGLESMVRSRERAGRSLLGTPEGAPSPLPNSLEEEEQEFAEWEKEAKELADEEPVQSGIVIADDEEEVDGLLEAIAVEDEPRQVAEYPDEMEETPEVEPEEEDDEEA